MANYISSLYEFGPQTKTALLEGAAAQFASTLLFIIHPSLSLCLYHYHNCLVFFSLNNLVNCIPCARIFFSNPSGNPAFTLYIYSYLNQLLKGTVRYSMRFLNSGFFHESTDLGVWLKCQYSVFRFLANSMSYWQILFYFPHFKRGK